MIFPRRVENLQHQRPFHPPHFGAEVIVDHERGPTFQLFAIEFLDIAHRHFRIVLLELGDKSVELAISGDFANRDAAGSVGAIRVSMVARGFREHYIDLPLQIGVCIDCFMLIAAAVLNQQGTNVVAALCFLLRPL